MRECRRGSSLLPLVLLVGLAGCASEPTEKVNAANQAQQAAVAAGATDYAPDAMNQVATLQTGLQTELAAQHKRFALFRRYGHAAALADSLKAVSDAAAEEATAARQQAQGQADSLLKTVGAVLTEVQHSMAIAPVGKGSAVDLAALRGDVDGASKTLMEAQAAFEAGDYRGAITKATAAQDVLEKVRQSIQQARTMTRAS